MKKIEMIKTETTIDIRQMKHLKLELQKGIYMVTLIDGTGYEILKGYGNTPIEAINDLHSNLI